MQAQFLRDIATSYKRAPRKIQSAQLSAFRSEKGAYHGNTSAICYSAYIFFLENEDREVVERQEKTRDGGCS
jgi:hypothetical protein